MNSADGGEMFFLGLHSLQPENFDGEDMRLLRQAARVMVPAGRIGDLVVQRLWDIDGVGTVHRVKSADKFSFSDAVVYCGLGAVIPYDPVACSLYRKIPGEVQIHIRQTQPVSRQIQSSALLEDAGLCRAEVEDAAVMGAHQLQSYVGCTDGLWVEGLWCERYRAGALRAVGRLYPPSHPAFVIDAEGLLTQPLSKDFGRFEEATAAELCGAIDGLTLPLAYLPPPRLDEKRTRDAVRAGQAFSGLFRVVHRLRAPGGCPWDRQQDHSSLTPFLLEECHELIDAIDKDSQKQLPDELGDVLLQVLLHSVIAFEDSDFTAETVMRTLTEKMVFRHPHVFADVEARTEKEVERNWEQLKSQKRKRDGEEGRSESSYLSGVPLTLPALLQAEKVQRVASQVGFDWPDISGPLEKVTEELGELAGAVEQNRSGEIEEEFGDLLFALVNVARFLDVSAELQLRRTVGKFRERFSAIEMHAEDTGRNLKDLTLDEMDRIWEECKENGQ